MAKKRAWIHALPGWAIINSGDGYVEVDPDVVYPMWLDEMERLDVRWKGENIVQKPTQCALEAARMLFTRYLKAIMYDNGGEGQRLYLRILKKDRKWALRNFPVGVPIPIDLIKRKLGLGRALGRGIDAGRIP